MGQGLGCWCCTECPKPTSHSFSLSPPMSWERVCSGVLLPPPSTSHFSQFLSNTKAQLRHRRYLVPILHLGGQNGSGKPLPYPRLPVFGGPVGIVCFQWITEWLRLEGISGGHLVQSPRASCPPMSPVSFSIPPRTENPQPLWVNLFNSLCSHFSRAAVIQLYTKQYQLFMNRVNKLGICE